MRSSLATLLLLLAAGRALADDVRGRVHDAKGQPIAGATVLSGAVEGAVTDAEGRFVLSGARAGATSAASVMVVADGYEAATVTAGSDDVDIVLDESSAAAGEVVEISGKAPAQAEPTSYEMTGDEVRAIPGAANDALRALQSLPGVARVPFNFGGLVLRGQSPRDTRVYLDGIDVPLAFHFGGVTSFYPSAMLDTIELTPGGFGAEYGRGQGGIVTLTTKDAHRDHWRAAGDVNLVDSAARADGPAGGGGLSIAVRRSYIDAILAGVLAPEDRVLPRYYDGQIRWSTGDERGRGALTALGFFSFDQVKTIDATANMGFARAALQYARRWGDTRLVLTPWLGRDVVSFEGQDGENPSAEANTAVYRRASLPFGARASLTHDVGWGALAGGLDLRGGRFGSTTVSVDGVAAPVNSSTADWSSDLGFWTEGRLNAGGRLTIRPGVRLEHYGDTGEWVLDPRLGTSLKLTDRVTLRQALGAYHQPPTHADLDPDVGNPALRSSWAMHASVGADVDLPQAIHASITGYAISSRDLPVAVARPDEMEPPARSEGGLGPIFQELFDAQLGSFQYRANAGRGRSMGVELSLKRHVGRWFAWLSYTYARAERTDDPQRFTGWRPYELDQTHNANGGASTTVGKWTLGARVRFATGNPYTPSIGMTVDELGNQVSIPGEPLSANLPPFFALDVRADRHWHRGWGDMDLFLDVQNATNYRSPEGLEAITDGKPEYTRGLPILPIIGVSYTPPK
ncbi:MAG: TonB-dependent receptor [Deltaproteobacteria bacterium]|nr:TonB-dependent receptor [Deltaproteobacteria bacterium]